MFYNAPTVSKQGVKSENSVVALCAHTDCHFALINMTTNFTKWVKG